MEESKKKAFSLGLTVLMLLAILTAGEFVLGLVAYNWWAPLLLVALLKAFFVVRDYMHVGRVFGGDEEAHS